MPWNGLRRRQAGRIESNKWFMQGWQGVGGKGPSVFNQLGKLPLGILDSLLPPSGCKVGDGLEDPVRLELGRDTSTVATGSLPLSTRCGFLEQCQAAVAYQETESKDCLHLQWVGEERLDTKNVNVAKSFLITGDKGLLLSLPSRPQPKPAFRILTQHHRIIDKARQESRDLPIVLLGKRV